ncbi:MAG: sigma-70 family RNA polymerase sigma factor [Planctomycetota bacterium]
MSVSAKQAFEILVRENAGMLRAYIFSLVRDVHLADEIFQETFLTAWKKLDTYDNKHPFGVWLRGIAAVHAMSKKRLSATDKLHYFDEEVLSILEKQFTGISSCKGDTWADKLEALNKCIEKLPADSREVLSLHYHENHTCKEIADKKGFGLEKVKKELQRLRHSLFECIRTKLFSSTGEI